MLLIVLETSTIDTNYLKRAFACTELEYLGYWLTPTGVQPLPKKVEAIKRLQLPKNLKQLRSFLGMIKHFPAERAGRFPMKSCCWCI
jgi:DNA-binding LytR/AlgR family response regulator